jgi:hypothetical protein
LVERWMMREGDSDPFFLNGAWLMAAGCVAVVFILASVVGIILFLDRMG